MVKILIRVSSIFVSQFRVLLFLSSLLITLRFATDHILCTCGYRGSLIKQSLCLHFQAWLSLGCLSTSSGVPVEPSSSMVKGVCKMHPQLLTTQLEIISLKHKAESQRHFSLLPKPFASVWPEASLLYWIPFLLRIIVASALKLFVAQRNASEKPNSWVSVLQHSHFPKMQYFKQVWIALGIVWKDCGH